MNITNTQVPQSGHGNSLPASGGAAELSIVHIPNEENREIGDGTATQHDSAQSQTAAAPQTTQTQEIVQKTGNNVKQIKTSLKIASLNMRGRFNNGSDKWIQLKEIIMSQKIGVLALQETNLSDEEEEVLNSRFKKDWVIMSSINPNTPAAGGVAIIFNKRLTNYMGISKKELIPG
jgi:hypothetical protein